MADTLAREVRLNHQQKRTIIVLILVVVLLLLLWARNRNVTNNVTNNKLGDLLTTPQYLNVTVPGLELPEWNDGDDWDWMQSTDCACDCSAPAYVPTTPSAIMVTQYAYIAGPTLSPMPTIPFPVYQAPPLPTWWYEPGYNVHHEKATYIYTSDGVSGTLGKYSRSGWNDPMGRGTYPQQTKNVTRQGDDAYIDGRHYKHDPRKDRTWPASTPIPPSAIGVYRG